MANNELDQARLVKSIEIRLQHSIEETPKRNVIFEVESSKIDIAFKTVLRRLRGKYDRIDVIIHVNDDINRVSALIRETLFDYTLLTLSNESVISSDVSKVIRVGTMTSFMCDRWKQQMVGKPIDKDTIVVLYCLEDLIEMNAIEELHSVGTIQLSIDDQLKMIYQEALGNAQDSSPELSDAKLSDQLTLLYLNKHLSDLSMSAFLSTSYQEGNEYCIIKNSSGDASIYISHELIDKPGLIQFLQLKHSLPLSPFTLTTVATTPAHFLKEYGTLVGVMRGGGYEIHNWTIFIKYLDVYPARRCFSIAPFLQHPRMCKSIDDWINKVKRAIVSHPNSISIIVCPNLSLLNVTSTSLSNVSFCDTVESLRDTVVSRRGRANTVLTTKAHFERWHQRPFEERFVYVILGTDDKRSMHAAHRFANPSINVITVPFESTSREGADSGYGSPTWNGICDVEDAMENLSIIPNRNHWIQVFAKDVAVRDTNGRKEEIYKGRIDMDDIHKRYVENVEWMRNQWNLNYGNVTDYMNDWIDTHMRDYYINTVMSSK